jgi:hypothetical protein
VFFREVKTPSYHCGKSPGGLLAPHPAAARLIDRILDWMTSYIDWNGFAVYRELSFGAGDRLGRNAKIKIRKAL